MKAFSPAPIEAAHMCRCVLARQFECLMRGVRGYKRGHRMVYPVPSGELNGWVLLDFHLEADAVKVSGELARTLGHDLDVGTRGDVACLEFKHDNVGVGELHSAIWVSMSADMGGCSPIQRCGFRIRSMANQRRCL